MTRLVIILLLLFACPARAEDYAVVVSVSAGIDQLEEKMIRDVFLRKRQFANSRRLFPVNITGDVEIRRAFEREVLGMNRDQLNQYWIESHFQGVSPPGTQASIEALIQVVSRVDGAITYLPRSQVTEQMRVIHEF